MEHNEWRQPKNRGMARVWMSMKVCMVYVCEINAESLVLLRDSNEAGAKR